MEVSFACLAKEEGTSTGQMLAVIPTSSPNGSIPEVSLSFFPKVAAVAFPGVAVLGG